MIKVNDSPGETMTKPSFKKKIILYDIVGFGIVMLFLWFNELFDFPHLILGSKSTPMNLTESILETAMVAALMIIVITFTRHLLKRIKHLEGFLRVCSNCKKIHVDGTWIPIEEYIRERSEAEFTHGFCPECADRYRSSLKPLS